MGNGNITQVLLASIKGKITPVLTKVKLWTSPNFIRTRLIAKIRTGFVDLFDIRPKHKKDYYEIFGWLVSKKLAFAIVVVTGTLSLLFLINSHTASRISNETVKTYHYSSLLLRFAKGQVVITGKGGYKAYEGDVKGGAVNGRGRLYNKVGGLVYQGAFVNNCYEGKGIQYYVSGNVKYDGEFSNNIYEGSGKLYRDGGGLMYDGGFVGGLKEGEGKLYDGGSNLVFTGNFSKDHIVYSDLLNKTTAEAKKAYSGSVDTYQGADGFVVFLDDIDAAYAGRVNTNSVDEEVHINCVAVLKNTFFNGTKEIDTVADLTSYFGEPVYQGNSLITEAEAICMRTVSDKPGDLGMTVNRVYDDFTTVESFNRDYTVYLYSFEKDSLIYTFICDKRGGKFRFYEITPGQAA